MWGFGVYVAMEPTYQTAEYQKTVQNTTVNGKINTTKGIIGLTNDKNLPSLDSVQKLLKKSITTLSDPIYLTFVSILMDCWAMQKYAQPLHFEERKSMEKAVGNSDQDEDEDNSDNESEEEGRKLARNSIGKSDFSVFRQASNANTNATGTPTIGSVNNMGDETRTFSLSNTVTYTGYDVKSATPSASLSSATTSSSILSSSSSSSSSSSTATESPTKTPRKNDTSGNNKIGKKSSDIAERIRVTRGKTTSSDKEAESGKRKLKESKNTHTKAAKIQTTTGSRLVKKKMDNNNSEDEGVF
jgi:hypothetical protein